MNTSAQDWLASRAAPAGMLACGLRRPDGEYLCHSREAGCPVENMKTILHQFETSHAALASEGLAPHWWTWSFAQGEMRFVLRPDGWLLGLVAQFDSEAMHQLDPLSLEFRSLKLRD